MNELLFNPLFGLALTLFFALGFWRLKSFTSLSFINPLLFSIIMIIILLQSLHIPYEAYKQGADLIHMFLGPITVILAVPLYEHRKAFIKHKLAILMGSILGTLSSFITVFIFAHYFGLSEQFMHSLLPKSITTPIGISASQMLEGIIGLSVVSIVITGIFGSLVAPFIFKNLNIKSEVAKGVCLGVTSHVIGTAKAYEISPLSGAMGALSIGLSGVISIIWISLYSVVMK